jgi:hypothetical protein
VLDWQVVPPGHALLQVPQWLLSDAKLEQEPEQRVGVAAGQPEAQAKVLPEGPQTGVAPLHAVPHAPQ